MRSILLFIFVSIINASFAQDTMRFRQKDASLFSNHYFFYPKGTFKHYFKTDDLQTWYGKGKFRKGFSRYILKFDSVIIERPQIKTVPKMNEGSVPVSFFELGSTSERIFLTNIDIRNNIDKATHRFEIDIFKPNANTTFNIPNSFFKGITTIHVPASGYSLEEYVQINSIEVLQNKEIHVYLDRSTGNLTHFIKPKKEILKIKGKFLQMPDRYHTVKGKTIELELF